MMLLADAQGLPLAAHTSEAEPHENRLIQAMFDFMVSRNEPSRTIGDKACDSDELDARLAARGIEMIAPHRAGRREPTQDGRPLRRYKRRWTVERSISRLKNLRRLCIRREKSACLSQGFLHPSCSPLLLKTPFE